MSEQKEINDYLKSEITLYCQLVARGAKTISVSSVQDRYVEQAKDIALEQNVCCTFKRLAEGWAEMLVFKNTDVLPLLREMPDPPHTKQDHALLGFLFGYSPDAILEFIKTVD